MAIEGKLTTSLTLCTFDRPNKRTLSSHTCNVLIPFPSPNPQGFIHDCNQLRARAFLTVVRSLYEVQMLAW